MVTLHHPDGHAAGGSTAGSGRLNLLLSDAHWERESWADRLPPLLAPMGVRSIRAATGREAEAVIRSERIHVAIVDMALPLDAEQDAQREGGSLLLDLLRRLDLVPPTVVIRRKRTHRDEAREIHAALRAGAFAVIDRPANHAGFETMLGVLRRALSRFYNDRWPTPTSSPTSPTPSPHTSPSPGANPISPSPQRFPPPPRNAPDAVSPEDTHQPPA